MDSRAPLCLRHLLITVLGAFVLSRFIVFAAALLPLLVTPGAREHSPHDRVLVELSSPRIGDALARMATAGDAGWYREIALQGYTQRPFDATAQENWAFFPLHPLLLRGAAALLGESPLVSMAMAHIALLVALALLYLLVRASGRDEAACTRSVYVLALFPASYFLSFPWSESLFLALSIGAMLAVQHGRWGWVAALGACGSATRFAGVFLAPALLARTLQHRVRPDLRQLAALAAIPLGLAAFMAWLWFATGNPFAFSDVQAAWGRDAGLPVRALGIIVLRPWEVAVDWNVRWLNLAALLLGLAALRHFLVRREVHFAAFLALGLFAPLLTGNITSLARYLLGLFPVAIALGDWCARPGVERAWFALSVTVLVLMSAAFGLGLTFALT